MTVDIISLSLFSGAAHQVLQGIAKADVLRTCDSSFTDQCTSHIPEAKKYGGVQIEEGKKWLLRKSRPSKLHITHFTSLVS